MRADARSGLVGLCLIAGAARAQNPPDSLRLVVATGAVCHSLPDPGSPVAERYHLGDVVGASKSTRGLGGRVYYFDSWRVKGISPTCWIAAGSTVPFDRQHPESGFDGVVKHVLDRADASFDELVEAENFLIEPNHYAGVGASPLATSPLLQFRRLMLIDRAARLLDAHSLEDAPVKRAWVLAHGNVLAFFEPDANWYMSGSPYWRIYDANAGAAWADELAWVAAQHVSPGDECGAGCFLAMITEGPQQYWTRRPQGASIGAALALASKLATNAIDAIAEEAPTKADVARVRSSLARVVSPDKARLLQALDRLDAAAKP